MPIILAVPDVGFASPHIILNEVDFPAPFGPKSPNISPFLILKVLFLTA